MNNVRFRCGCAPVLVNWVLSLFHHVLRYLRTLCTVWSLLRRRVTRRLTGLKTMQNILKRLRLIFQFTYVQYCSTSVVSTGIGCIISFLRFERTMSAVKAAMVLYECGRVAVGTQYIHVQTIAIAFWQIHNCDKMKLRRYSRLTIKSTQTVTLCRCRPDITNIIDDCFFEELSKNKAFVICSWEQGSNTYFFMFHVFFMFSTSCQNASLCIR